MEGGKHDRASRVRGFPAHLVVIFTKQINNFYQNRIRKRFCNITNNLEAITDEHAVRLV